MSSEPEDKSLLNDVTLEGADFREAMLGQTLRVARRRRHWRQARHAAALFVVLGVAGFLVYRQGERRSPTPVAQSVSHAYRLVQTRPLPPAALVSTRPFDGTVTAVAPIRIVQTAPTTGKLRLLNDDELLTLVARPAILIRLDAHTQRLIFANPEDEKGLQAQ